MANVSYMFFKTQNSSGSFRSPTPHSYLIEAYAKHVQNVSDSLQIVCTFRVMWETFEFHQKLENIVSVYVYD